MLSGMCDEVGRGDISHKCCNVDTVKGSVKHIMFGHGRGCTNCNFFNTPSLKNTDICKSQQIYIYIYIYCNIFKKLCHLKTEI